MLFQQYTGFRQNICSVCDQYRIDKHSTTLLDKDSKTNMTTNNFMNFNVKFVYTMFTNKINFEMN